MGKEQKNWLNFLGRKGDRVDHLLPDSERTSRAEQLVIAMASSLNTSIKYSVDGKSVWFNSLGEKISEERTISSLEESLKGDLLFDFESPSFVSNKDGEVVKKQIAQISQYLGAPFSLNNTSFDESGKVRKK